MRHARTLWGILAFLGLLAAMAGLMPRRAELLEVQARAASPVEAVRLLEAERQRDPADAEVATRLSEAYERAGAHEPALTLLAAEARRRTLSKEERQRVKRVALGLGAPARALGVLAKGPLDLADRRELVTLALAAGRPAVALAQQEAILAVTPSDPRALEKARDLAIAVPALDRAIRYQGRLAATLGTPESTERLITLHLQAGDPAGALSVLEASPRRGESAAWHRRAVQYATWAQAPARALPHMVSLYEAQPDRALGLTLARTLATAGDVRALPFARRLYDADPEDADSRDHLIQLLVAGGRREAASGLLLAAWERQPADAAAHRRLVDFLLAGGDRAGAATLLARWVEAHPTDRAALHRLATIQVWDGQMATAWSTYARLLAGRPAPAEEAWRREWLAISRPVDDAAPEGRENLAALVAAGDDPAVIRRAAAAALEAGDRAEAIALARRLAGMPGALGEDTLRLAEWLLWDGQLAEGLERLRTLDARSPLPEDVLKDAADRAGAARRFKDATDFLARIATRSPRSPAAWEDLARARVAAGDAAGAAVAWKRRLALPGADASSRLQAAGLYLQLDRPVEAEAVLADVSAASLGELRLKSALAYELKRPEAQARALEAILAVAPQDVEARLSLSELLALRGAMAEATAHEDAAIALRPQDPALLARIAGRRLYGPEPAQAETVIAKLSALADPGLEGWRVIADYAHTRSPERAAAALDKLHLAGGGDAETYFRRGELAAAALSGAVAEEAYAEAARLGGVSAAPAEREAAAYALERLGRGAEAQDAWKQLKRSEPSRVAAHAALARRAIAEGALEEAEQLLEAAPEDPAIAYVRADWLRAAGRDAEAAEAFGALRETDRAPYLAVAEAMARHGAGQYGQAREVVLEALSRSADPELLAAHRVLRDRGASRTGFKLYQERYAALERTRIGAVASQRLGDRVRLGTELSRASWDGGRLSVEELGLAIEAEAGPLVASARLAVPRGQAPLGGVALAYAEGAVTGSVALGEARWEETSAVAIAGGRERQLTLGAGWQPEARLALRAEGTIGQLRLPGAEAGLAGTGLVEATLRPAAASPFFLAYQLRHRAWGATGPPVGLPTQLTTQAASLGWAGEAGPVRVSVQPGGVYDGTALAPMIGGTLALGLGPDRELSLEGVWSGRAANVGGAGSYESVTLNGTWWF